MLDSYERKTFQQKQEIKQLTKELLDVYQLYKDSLDKLASYSDFQARFKNTVHEQAAISMRYSLSIPDPIVALSEEVPSQPQQHREQAQKQGERIRQLLDSLDNIKSLGLQSYAEAGKVQSYADPIPTIKPKRKHSQNSHSPITKPKRNASQASLQRNQQQLSIECQLEEQKHLNENLKIKLDVSLAECDELTRQVDQFKRKVSDLDKTKKLLDQLTQENERLIKGKQDLENNLELHKSSNSDLRRVIQRLDSELQREKSQLQLINKNFYDNTLFEGIIGEDDKFFVGEGKLELRAKQRSKSGTRQNERSRNQIMVKSGTPEERISQQILQPKLTPSSAAIPNQQQNNEKQKRIVEDLRSMIELQSTVIEDLLIKQRLITAAPKLTRDNISQLSATSPDRTTERFTYPRQQETPGFEENNKRGTTMINRQTTEMIGRNEHRMNSLKKQKSSITAYDRGGSFKLREITPTTTSRFK